MTQVELTVNGDSERVNVPAHWTLLQLLRDGLGLLGTQEGCGEGSCGSCTVLVDDRLVRSCLFLAARLNGRDVATVEGLEQGGNLHPLQRTFIEQAAIQCGFCTPGFLMASVKLLEENPTPDGEEIREFLAGNLCRCGSYEQIVAAVREAAAEGSP